MQQYKITLKNDKLRSYNRISVFIILILTLLYIYLAFFTTNTTQSLLKIITLSFIGLSLIGKFIFPDIKNRQWLWILFIFLAMGFTNLRLYWLTGISGLMGVIFLYATKEKIVDLSASHIIYPSFPSKKISWPDLNNCLIKDTLLTIDFKNNKVIQQLIDEKTGSLNEKEFNDFCKEQLMSTKSYKSN